MAHKLKASEISHDSHMEEYKFRQHMYITSTKAFSLDVPHDIWRLMLHVKCISGCGLYELIVFW